MAKHSVIDLMPFLKARKCECFDSCDLMIYGPGPSKEMMMGRKKEEVDDSSDDSSDGMSNVVKNKKIMKKKRNEKGVKAVKGRGKGGNDGLEWKKAIRLEIECQTRDCKGECGKDWCGKCYAREKPFERMKAVRKDLRKARRKRKLELRKEMLKQYVDEMFD